MANEDLTLAKAEISRILHFVIYNRGKIECRPGIVVQDFGGSEDNRVNMQVFTDGSNDGEYGVDKHQHHYRDSQYGIFPTPNDKTSPANLVQAFHWETSVLPDHTYQTVGSWHWPRMCRTLKETLPPYTDRTGIMVFHNHNEGIAGDFCSACRRQEDERTPPAKA